MVPKSRNCARDGDFGTHYVQNCAWDDDQDHTINDFGSHYD